MTLSPRAQQLLARQQDRYMQSLADKRLRIEDSYSAILCHGWTPEHSEKLKTRVHKLSGSAGSYGLDALGQAAQKLDALLAGGAGGKQIDVEPESELGALMTAMIHELDLIISNIPKQETVTRPTS